MFFVSRGQGFWLLASLFIVFPIAEGIAKLLSPEIPPKWPVTIALIISGLVSLALGIHARISPARLVLERQTGRERMLRPVHSVYGLRAEYWCALYLWTSWLVSYHAAN